MQLSFFGFTDTEPPVIEPNGIEVGPARAPNKDAGGRDPERFMEKRNGRLVVAGDVAITVTAYDRVDGNGLNRKLGLYKLGYQILNEDRTPVKGFEQPSINIEFNRLPPEDSSVSKVFANGSGVSAYGTPTRFKYIVTNRVRDGEAISGVLRTSSLAPGLLIKGLRRTTRQSCLGKTTSSQSKSLTDGGCKVLNLDKPNERW